MTETTEPGFEYEGRFYPLRIGNLGKDWMLIEQLTNMSIDEFYDAVSGGRNRLTTWLATIATSLRAGNPDWTVERIVRIVQNLDVSTLEVIGGDQEEAPQAVPPPNQKPDAASSPSTNTGSSASSTPQDNSSSETSYATPV